MNEPLNNRAWLGVLPVLLIVAFSAVIPLMTVVNYSVQDIFDVNTRLFVGLDWYRETLRDPRFLDALLRQLTFSGIVLAIELPLGVLVAAFILKDVNDVLGLAPFVVQSMEPLLTPELLPTAVFLSMAVVSFMTGSNWGVFVIILPIVTALATSLDADMPLVIGATLSASTFGSHACFYSDATVLTAQASGCTPFQHAITQIPYALIAAAIATAGYLAIAYL